MAMNTVFLHLSEEAIKRLNKLRGWRKVSRSAILREAVEQYLERQQFPVRKAKAAGKGTRQLVLKNYVRSIRNDKNFSFLNIKNRCPYSGINTRLFYLNL